MNLSADLNVVFSTEKKREVSLKVEPKRSSLFQDVGLRQRGLGGIPDGAVSGTCNNHRDEKVHQVAAHVGGNVSCLCGDV